MQEDTAISTMETAVGSGASFFDTANVYGAGRSEKLTVNTMFAETDHRNFNRDGQRFNVGETFAGLPYEKGVDLADMLKELVPDGMSMAQMALRWILDHDAVSVIIPGASSPNQAKENTTISELAPLPSELHEALAEFYATNVHAHIRGPY
jgi:aryl-alcohol dehydrogenase-like predicted oxidoreductase